MTRARTALICSLLLTLFAALALASVRSKSPTYDEPLHALAAWLQIHHGDFRIDTENPPLWKYWAGLPNGRDAISPAPREVQVRDAADSLFTAPLVVPTLFRSPATDAQALILRGRIMMLILAVALGALIAWWSWRLGGSVAAVVATAAFALDPTFLAHGPLIKNDVTLALTLLGLAVAVWRAGMRLSVANAFAVALLCAGAINVKFSALVFGPMVMILLIIRALLPLPWQRFGRVLQTRAARLGAAVALCGFALLITVAVTWACYGFRFAPSAQSDSDLQALRTSVLRDISRQRGNPPFVRTLLWAHEHRLFPQAWLTGLLSTYQVSLGHDNYLAGRSSRTGWWYYFPIAMLVKSPMALLLACGLALVIGIGVLRRRRDPWAIACLSIPPIVFLLLAMSSNLNYGVRHVLPVYPFIYIGVGLAAAYAWQRRRRLTAAVAGALALCLLTETLAAFPHYIAFFNFAAVGSRGGFHLLGDSNLDWGQDLLLLAEWQRRHPDKDLYLAYYGAADPAYYGIRYHNLPGGLGPPPASQLPARGGGAVLAVSATILQGIYLPEDLRAFYEPLRRSPPSEILGGSIYLFDLSGR